jgi:phosphohistidine phosphatase SixA
MRIPGRLLRVSMALALWAAALPALAEEALEQALKPQLDPAQIAEALKQGGYVILLRHMSTATTLVDDDFVDMADCDTQRTLSDRGRLQAIRIGEAFRALGIQVAEVLTSPYCRCIATGELAFGEGVPQTSEILAAQGGMSGSERGAQVRKLLATRPPGPGNTVLISHTAALLYSFGLQAKPEGIAHVFHPNEIGPATYIGMVQADEWPVLAGLEPVAP